ncbi:transporter substrate-binding domain-containing protein [Alkalimonas collagenimarina]|uniref:Transporter substrate-binding domain-containing protein n=1 Tax=Alkalimonas collagenimarina TaxID=400390 RepID=A0ABT9GWS7_9GAMM|nr:transporter substrate-binding domain-containing protein [Alkalimonas collagenimarina]MDP4535518.1 transporter substrate-binding domain-containing protein [Alkalimonas collagenimarina]
MRAILALSLWLVSTYSVAENTLTVLVGMDKPPYIQLQDGTGFELELLRKVALHMGYEAVFLHVPNARIRYLLEQGHGDVATLQNASDFSIDLFYSLPYIRYQNAVITLRHREFQIQHSQDLARLSVIGFQNASHVLGPDFAEMAEASRRYQETTNQKTQVDMLLANRVDAAVMDINIFHYFRRVADDNQPIQLHSLFPVSDYRAAFRERRLQQEFDQALVKVQRNEHYRQLQLEFFGSVNQLSPLPATP